MKLTTVTVKIWKRVLEKFDEKVEAACLRRDAFLGRVIEIELVKLIEEIPCPNSEAVFKFIAQQIDLLDRKPVSIKLPTHLVQELDRICADRRIPRDAYFNRILFLLATSNKAINRVFFGVDEWTRWLIKKYGEGEYLRTEQERIFYPLTPHINPFEEIREGLALYKEDEKIEEVIHSVTREKVGMVRDIDNLSLPRRFYTVVLDDEQFPGVNLYGLNCYLPEWRVPGSSEEKLRTKRLDELFDL
ncbi:MAG: hypothetical protein EXR28_14730 [Betaproteobacteria bacterium]|nr:hypothetical protein [Betaproteobacteria bacterium]